MHGATVGGNDTAVWLFCTLDMPQAIHMTDKQLQLLMQVSTKRHQEISKC